MNRMGDYSMKLSFYQFKKITIRINGQRPGKQSRFELQEQSFVKWR
jgi:hypothetical protein